MSDNNLEGYRPALDAEQHSDPLQLEPQEGGQPEFVTRQDFEDRISKLEQSLTDKAVNRIEKKLVKWKNNLKDQGMDVTPAMLEQARQELAISELRQLDDEDAAAQPVPKSSGPFTPDAVAKVQARMAQLQAEHGIELKPGDEEYDTMPWNDPNPDRFLGTFDERLKAKAARLKGPGLPPNSVRSPGPQGGAVGNDLFNQYQQEVEKANTVNQRLGIRHKYRELGLEI